MTDFCRHCGARIPPIEGEGTCPKCDPTGVRVHVLERRVAELEADADKAIGLAATITTLRAKVDQLNAQNAMMQASRSGTIEALRAENAELKECYEHAGKITARLMARVAELEAALVKCREHFERFPLSLGYWVDAIPMIDKALGDAGNKPPQRNEGGT